MVGASCLEGGAALGLIVAAQSLKERACAKSCVHPVYAEVIYCVPSRMASHEK